MVVRLVSARTPTPSRSSTRCPDSRPSRREPASARPYAAAATRVASLTSVSITARSCARSSSSGSASRSCALPSESSAADDARAHQAQHLARLGLGPDAAERAGARADHRDRLAAEHPCAGRPRGPVERVLERSRDRAVVLGDGDQHRVGGSDRGAQARDRRAAAAPPRPRRRREGRGAPPRSRARRRRGGRPAASRSSSRLCEPLRRLPAMPRIAHLRLAAGRARARPSA